MYWEYMALQYVIEPFFGIHGKISLKAKTATV